MAEIYQLPDNGGSNANAGGIPFSIPLGGNGGLFGNGNNSLADLFGFAIIASMFGWNGGWGNGFGGGMNGQGAFLANQINNDSGRELIMNAINSNGEASRAAIQNLATMLGQDFNTVNSAVQNVQNSLATLAAQQGMSTLQVQNAIQAGNAALMSQFQQCCCQNQLAIERQTNTLQQTANQGFNGVTMGLGGISRQIEAKSAADQLSVCQQTYTLTDGANRNTQAILAKMDAIEDARKDREIVAKDAEIATLKSQNFIAAAIGQATAPINAQLAQLNKEVDDIKCKQPNTVSVQYPNLVAMNATPYVSGGFYGQGFNGYGGFNF
jgi:hypothetical protein